MVTIAKRQIHIATTMRRVTCSVIGRKKPETCYGFEMAELTMDGKWTIDRLYSSN